MIFFSVWFWGRTSISSRVKTQNFSWRNEVRAKKTNNKTIDKKHTQKNNNKHRKKIKKEYNIKKHTNQNTGVEAKKKTHTIKQKNKNKKF